MGAKSHPPPAHRTDPPPFVDPLPPRKYSGPIHAPCGRGEGRSLRGTMVAPSRVPWDINNPCGITHASETKKFFGGLVFVVWCFTTNCGLSSLRLPTRAMRSITPPPPPRHPPRPTRVTPGPGRRSFARSSKCFVAADPPPQPHTDGDPAHLQCPHPAAPWAGSWPRSSRATSATAWMPSATDGPSGVPHAAAAASVMGGV